MYLWYYKFIVRDTATNKGFTIGTFKAATLDNALAVVQLKCEALGLDFANVELIDTVYYQTDEYINV